jgi:hypothetical protein
MLELPAPEKAVPFWMSFTRPDFMKPGCCVRCKMREQRIRMFWPQKCMHKKNGRGMNPLKKRGRAQMRFKYFQSLHLNG